MLRTVLAVVLAVALLAAAMPAVERARVASADAAARRTVAGLFDAVERLDRSSDAVPPDRPGARRVVGLRLPERGPGSRGVAAVAVGGVPGRDHPRAGALAEAADADVVAYRVRGERYRVIRVPGVDFRIVRDCSNSPDAGPLVVEDDDRLVLRLAAVDGERVVLVGTHDCERASDDGWTDAGTWDEPAADRIPGRITSSTDVTDPGSGRVDRHERRLTPPRRRPPRQPVPATRRRRVPPR